MKNRRNIIIAFLLCATLLVGVGYAAVADVLDVDGTAEYGIMGDFDGNIQFTEAYSYQTISDSASVSETNKDKVTFTAKSIVTSEDKAYFKFTVVNNNTTDATIYLSNYSVSGTLTDKESGEASDGSNIYMVRYSFGGIEHATSDDVKAGEDFTTAETGQHSYSEGAETNYTLAAGQTGYLYVEVSLDNVKNPNGFPNNKTVSATFGLEFSIWSDAADASNP